MAMKNEQLNELYRVMVRIRTFEERVAREFATGNIPGMVHPYSGQEAIAAGACAILQPDDYITSTHRGNGHLIAKGAQTDRMMAEIYGRKTGYNKGKGGCLHIASVELGILGANGMVGGGITIATGAALSAQIRGTDQVAICFLGDGACNRGTFHEAINLAACWDLPVIYIIENNMYAGDTPVTSSCKLAELSKRAKAYGIPGQTVDGNDVLAIYEAVNKAVIRARKGKGPTLIECKTYRQRGHFEGEIQSYKTREEVEEWRKKDPIPRFRNRLVEMDILTDKAADKIVREANAEIERAVKFAEASPFPSPEEALEDVYAWGGN
ncbi:MAG: pyruvate dehydrogenase (acetyl-transferring) E1 component subunit alpha [Chloroflexi bacterium RBG_16_50_9]|nr:MAG: pyruvate dehydrogenase (acetyl-transferring) E1 component subunit alpha [Chloroflexi bacterium RBG_16_50_9]